MEPLYEPVPERFSTPRLIVRSALASDAPAVNTAVLESFDDLHPYIPWATSVPTLEQSEASCRRMQANFLLRQDLTMMMFERLADGSEGAFIGGTGLHRIDWQVRRFEIGYWCRSSRVGRGLVSEAVEAMTRMAFGDLRARRVEIRVDEANARSWRVAERAGYVFEGLLRQQSLSPAGEPRDMRVYAKIAV